MTDAAHLITLVVIMLACGVLGGLVNFWAVPKIQLQTESHPVLKRISAGVAASLAVPLFLNMISSSLVADSKTDFLKLLVIAGFCIVAAISSKAFIDSISKKLLNQIDQLDKEQQSLREDMEPVIAKEKEPAEEAPITSRQELDDEDKKVLRILVDPKWSMRSLNGIIRDTGLGEGKATKSLKKLSDLALVRKSAKDGKDWWWLTSDGRSVAKDV